jgi:hypothetical protein
MDAKPCPIFSSRVTVDIFRFLFCWCLFTLEISKVRVQGVKSLGGHFACLCWEFDFQEVDKKILEFLQRNGKYF